MRAGSLTPGLLHGLFERLLAAVAVAEDKVAPEFVLLGSVQLQNVIPEVGHKSVPFHHVAPQVLPPLITIPVKVGRDDLGLRIRWRSGWRGFLVIGCGYRRVAVRHVGSGRIHRPERTIVTVGAVIRTAAVAEGIRVSIITVVVVGFVPALAAIVVVAAVVLSTVVGATAGIVTFEGSILVGSALVLSAGEGAAVAIAAVVSLRGPLFHVAGG
jgi:hypothetical protein